MLQYPVDITPDGKGFLATFPDIPEAITAGETREEVTHMAEDALITAMDFYFEDQRSVPMPSKVKRGQAMVALPVSVAVKVLLLNELVAQRVSQAELARRMHTRPQEVSRIVNVHHATKIDTLAAAFKALGRRLELTVA